MPSGIPLSPDNLIDPETTCSKGHPYTESNTYVWVSRATGRLRRHCKTCAQQRSKRNYEKDPEAAKECRRRYQERNRDHLNQKNREWRQANRESHRRSKANYRNANRERHRAWSNSYRSKKAGQLGEWKLPEVQFINLLFETYPYCYYCSCSLSEGYHIEHKNPLSRGGLHEPRNIRLSCGSCNVRKGNKTAEEFLEGSFA